MRLRIRGLRRLCRCGHLWGLFYPRSSLFSCNYSILVGIHFLKACFDGFFIELLTTLLCVFFHTFNKLLLCFLVRPASLFSKYRQRLSKFRIPSLRRLCRCGRAPIPLPGFEELLDLLRVQFAVLIRVRFGKTLEYSRQLLFGGLLRLRIRGGRRRRFPLSLRIRLRRKFNSGVGA